MMQPLPARDTDVRPSATEELSPEYMELIHRIEEVPAEFGWMMIYVGLLGFVVPGIFGLPFFVAGTAVLAPGKRTRLAQWAARKRRPMVQSSLRQITRLMDDLERRYPHLPS